MKFYPASPAERPGSARARPAFVDDPAFVQFLNALPVAAALVERDGRIRLVNLGFERLMATSRADLVGTDLSRLQRQAGEGLREAVIALSRLQRYRGEIVTPAMSRATLTLSILRAGDGPPYGGLLVVQPQGDAAPPGRAGAGFRLAAAAPGGADLVFEGEYATLRQRARRAVEAGMALLLSGETGTGKTTLVQALFGADPQRPLVHVACRHLTERNFDHEMFGIGAHGGAGPGDGGHAGRADGGILFLDGVDELAPPLQARLLAFLEAPFLPAAPGRARRRIGMSLVAALTTTEGETGQPTLRDDLRHRLGAVRLHLPPLRDEPAMREALMRPILARLAAQRGRPLELSAGFLARAREYDYPGNIRELENVLGHAALVAGDQATAEHFTMAVPPPDPRRFRRRQDGAARQDTLRRQVREFEEWVIGSTLAAHPSKRSAARALGIDVATLIRKTSRNDRQTDEEETTP